MTETYRVVIVGAGPAGIFAALELTRAGVDGVLLLEKGPDLPERKCRGRSGSMLSGWGGAGAYSDGKLALSTEIGGFLGQYCRPTQLAELVEYVDETYRTFGAPAELRRCRRFRAAPPSTTWTSSATLWRDRSAP